MHAQVLIKSGHSLLIIDPLQIHPFWPSYSSLEDVPLARIQQVNLWIIATPTDTHLSVLQDLLALRSDAHVLLEKPAVSPGQFECLQRLLEQYPESRMAVHDTYAFSPVTETLIANLKIDGRADRLESLAVEMSKNRLQDEDSGRFVDTQWGSAGYEGFHLLSLENRLREAFPSSDLHAKLITSTDGTLTLRPELLSGTFSPAARHLIRTGNIPYGNEFRFRLIQGRFASGLSFELAFEPLFGELDVDFKNTHCMAWSYGKTTHQVWIHGNHFAEALRRQIALLLENNRPTGIGTLREAHRLEKVLTPTNSQLLIAGAVV